ncbi:MAG TPA: LLM class flavin-dependent oxidoreductase [Gaiellaceae bacterium]|nr:LLM class flavin-dependent oxidoreductase [Gaiellaceae bacterium]
MSAPPVGLVLGSHLAPEEIASTARLGEELGFCELWLAEDYFFTGGISGAAAALAATETVPVGLGIVSAMVRHPALLAMEIATLARMFPGRVRPGIGLGVPSWVRQMHLLPRSRLGAMRECVTSVRRLLAGEELTERGDYVSFDRVRLAYPPPEPVPVFMGIIGPKMLHLSGEIADGTIGSVMAGARYLSWAREQIAAGQAAAGRAGQSHPFAAFAMFSIDEDGERARAAIRPTMAFYLAADPVNAMTEVYGIAEQTGRAAAGGAAAVEAAIEPAWVEDLVVAGNPGECTDKIRALLAAGADTVVLFPSPAERAREMLELAAAEVLPKLKEV